MADSGHILTEVTDVISVQAALKREPCDLLNTYLGASRAWLQC